MSSQSPRLQFVAGLPDSPKTEAKGVIFVRGPWYETRAPLTSYLFESINVIPRCVQVVGSVCWCIFTHLSFTFMYFIIFFFFFVHGKSGGVNW